MFKRTVTKTLVVFMSLLLAFALATGCAKKTEAPQKEGGKAAVQVTKPESVGMDSAKLASVDGIIKNAIEEKKIPGLVLLVAKDNKVVYFKSYGKQSPEQDMQNDTMFRMFSSSKMPGCMAVMQLVEQGKIKLDDPIAKYIPEYKDVKFEEKQKNGTVKLVTPAKEITVRQVLSQTAGIEVHPEAFKLDISGGTNRWDISCLENAKLMAKIPLVKQPGTSHSYHMSHLLLAPLIEVASGMPAGEYFKKNILAPLEMNSTYFYPPAEMMSRVSKTWENQNGVLTGVVNSPQDINSTWFTLKDEEKKFYDFSAGLVSTAEDYLKLSFMMLNDGTWNGKKILEPSSVKVITSNQIGDISDVSIFDMPKYGFDKYGFGCFVNNGSGFRDKGTIIDPSYAGNVWELNSGKHLAIIMLMQMLDSTSSYDTREAVVKTIYQSITINQ